jgi:hypothetical protein
MKRIGPPILLCLLFLLSTAAARSQLGIYGEFSATSVPGDAFLGTAAAWDKGASVGVYDDFLHAGPIGLGLDLRGGYGSANGSSSYSFLFGPRLAVKPPVLPIRAYVQASVGLGGVSANDALAKSTRTTGRLQYGFIGGLDYTLLPHLDLRLPEIGYVRTSEDQFSGGAAPANLLTVSAGVVLRLR